MTNGRLYQLNHCTYLCQYHLVWTTRYRGKILTGNYIKQELKRIFKQISKWKNLQILAWHVGDEHVHLYIIIPPKFSVSYVVCLIKAKSSAWIKKKVKKIQKGSFWARGYFVSTIGINEFALKQYIENQRHNQLPQPKLPLFWNQQIAGVSQQDKNRQRKLAVGYFAFNIYYFYVPISQEFKYFFCSKVNLSILIPMESSFNFATFSSISFGTE